MQGNIELSGWLYVYNGPCLFLCSETVLFQLICLFPLFSFSLCIYIHTYIPTSSSASLSLSISSHPSGNLFCYLLLFVFFSSFLLSHCLVLNDTTFYSQSVFLFLSVVHLLSLSYFQRLSCLDLFTLSQSL